MSRNEGALQGKIRILCLHGRRTSGKILSMQMAALRHHLQPEVELVFIDGTFPAYGPPDPMVAMIYEGMDYFEWILDGRNAESMARVVSCLKESQLRSAPFAGIMGFSQGAAMATRVLAEIGRGDGRLGLSEAIVPMFFVSIGGVTPKDEDNFLNATVKEGENKYTVQIPSLHILGDADPIKESSLRLTERYAEATRTIINHPEAHNIPSIRTGIYPQIREWIISQQQN